MAKTRVTPIHIYLILAVTFTAQQSLADRTRGCHYTLEDTVTLEKDGQVLQTFPVKISGIAMGFFGGVNPNIARRRARENLKSCQHSWALGDGKKRSKDIDRCNNQKAAQSDEKKDIFRLSGEKSHNDYILDELKSTVCAIAREHAPNSLSLRLIKNQSKISGKKNCHSKNEKKLNRFLTIVSRSFCGQ